MILIWEYYFLKKIETTRILQSGYGLAIFYNEKKTAYIRMILKGISGWEY